MDSQITKHTERSSLQSFIHLTAEIGVVFDKNLVLIDFNRAFDSRFPNYGNSLVSLTKLNDFTDRLINLKGIDNILEIEDTDTNILWKFKYDLKNNLFIGLGHPLKDPSESNYKKEYEDFLYTVSHDLNESTRTIKSLVFFLEKDLKEGFKESTKENLLYISTATSKLENRLNGLLMLSRTVRTEVQKEHLDVLSLVLQIAERGRYSSIIVSLQSDKPLKINTSKKLFQQMLVELLDNALLYNTSKKKKIEVVLSEGQLSIIDNGVGFNEKHIQNLFKPFYKISNGVKYAGSGIGLTIVDKIINKLDLNISVVSHEESGSTFTIFWNN